MPLKKRLKSSGLVQYWHAPALSAASTSSGMALADDAGVGDAHHREFARLECGACRLDIRLAAADRRPATVAQNDDRRKHLFGDENEKSLQGRDKYWFFKYFYALLDK